MTQIPSGEVTVSVYQTGGAVWTEFEVGSLFELAGRLFDWQTQPGCGRIIVRDGDRRTEWRRVADGWVRL